MLNFPITDFGELEISVHGVGGVSNASEKGVSVTVEDADSCPRYLAAVVRGVKVGPSPEWLVKRLDSIGVRSISNIVDITNYILHAFGQPVHAFDLNKLAGCSIVVRPTREGESIVTLDGVERKIATGTTVICDAERPVALAGVMGGRDSEVTEATTDILLEVAAFSPRFVRSVRRAVNLNTDASYRFERGIDAGALLEIATYGAAIIAQVGGGNVTSLLAAGVKVAGPATVTLRPSRVSHLIGAEIGVEEITKHLESIGCRVTMHESQLAVSPPTWRNDLGLEVDLIEEVARLKGFDALPNDLRATRPGAVPDHPLYVIGKRVRNALVELGLAETRPMPFTATPGGDSLRVRNPLADDEPFLRQSALETLARRAEFNLARMQGNVRLFEIGDAFVATSDRLPREELRAAALVMGMRRPPHFTEPEPPAYDLWDAKAVAERILAEAFPGEAFVFVAANGTRIWDINSNDGKAVGYVERVALDKPVWASEAFGVEITLGVISSADVAPMGKNAHAETTASPVAHAVHAKFRAIPITPAAEIDLALLVPDNVSAQQVEAVLRSAGGELLERVALFDEFRGNGVAVGHRSVAWHLTFRHPERTLRDKEIEGRRARLLETLSKELGIKPRAS